MSDDRERILREEGFRFFGAITASLSHDINNVLAIINELSGLLDDFLVAAEGGKALDPERLKATTNRISEQIARGQVYVRRLNGFAHTVDSGRDVIVVNDTVETVVSLCQRVAALRRVSIEARLPETSPRVEGSELDVQHLMFRCFDIAFDACAEGDLVDVTVEDGGESTTLTVSTRSNAGAVPELESKRAVLATLAEALNGTVELVVKSEDRLRIAVTLSHALNSPGDDHE